MARRNGKREVRSDDLVPVDSLLGDLDETFLLCRDVHHSWTVSGYHAVGGGAVERTLLCERCETERIDEWTLGGARVRSWYRYPDGYQFRGVDGSDDPRMALRREVLRRAGVSGTKRRDRR